MAKKKGAKPETKSDFLRKVLGRNPNLDARQVSQNPTNNGKRLTLTPEFSGSVWTTYDFPLGLTLGGGVRHMGEVFVNAANTIRVPAFSLVDAMVDRVTGT